MTTVAIVGGGVGGLSLAYVLAKQSISLSKILLFDTDDFAQTCSLRSTAIVAKRGISTGHSELGDELVRAFENFKAHVSAEAPAGIFPIIQYTSAMTKLETFRLRYPLGKERNSTGLIAFKEKHYVAEEEGFMVDPEKYLEWLRMQVGEKLQVIRTFITEISPDGNLHSLEGQWSAEKIFLTGGSWNPLLGPAKSKPVQGAYLEFENVELGNRSYSLTFEGDNFIYQSHAKKLLIGSTTDDFSHLLPDEHELLKTYTRLEEALAMKLPAFSERKLKVGLREKGPQRRPYISGDGKIWSMGGFYKNGWSLALLKAQELASKLT